MAANKLPDPRYTETSENYLSVDEKLKKRKIQNRTLKIIFGSILSIVLVWLVCYFSLDAFKVKSLKIDGLRNLTAEEFSTICQLDENASLLYFDGLEVEKNAISQSSGLILQANFNYSPFGGECFVTEDYPLASYHDEIFYSSLRSSDEVKSDLASLPFDEGQIETLQEKLDAERETSSTISLHFPLTMSQSDIDVALSNDNRLALASISSLDYEYVQYVEHVQFKSTDFSTFDACLYNQKRAERYILENVDIVTLNLLFEENSLYSLGVSSEDMNETTYNFLDGGKVQAYLFKVEVADDGYIQIIQS